MFNWEQKPPRGIPPKSGNANALPQFPAPVPSGKRRDLPGNPSTSCMLPQHNSQPEFRQIFPVERPPPPQFLLFLGIQNPLEAQTAAHCYLQARPGSSSSRTSSGMKGEEKLGNFQEFFPKENLRIHVVFQRIPWNFHAPALCMAFPRRKSAFWSLELQSLPQSMKNG